MLQTSIYTQIQHPGCHFYVPNYFPVFLSSYSSYSGIILIAVVLPPRDSKMGVLAQTTTFYHFYGVPTQSMKLEISLFTLSLTICYLLVYTIWSFMRSPNWRSPIGYFIIPTIYYNIHNLLYGPNFSWSLILRFLVIRSSLGSYNH